MKKVVSIFLAIALILSFTACDNGKAQEEAEATITSFMDNYCAFRLKDASQYIQNKDAYPLIYDDIDDAINSLKSVEMENEVSGLNDSYDLYLKPIFEKNIEKLSYEIINCEKTEGKFYFTINFESVDIKNVKVEYDQEAIMTEVTDELKEEGSLTEDMDKDEWQIAISAAMMEKIVPYALEAIDKAGTTTNEITLVVEKIDDKYLITDESDLNELMSTVSISG